MNRPRRLIGRPLVSSDQGWLCECVPCVCLTPGPCARMIHLPYYADLIGLYDGMRIHRGPLSFFVWYGHYYLWDDCYRTQDTAHLQPMGIVVFNEADLNERFEWRRHLFSARKEMGSVDGSFDGFHSRVLKVMKTWPFSKQRPSQRLGSCVLISPWLHLKCAVR